MLVILTNQQVLSTKHVCSSCLMADNGGLPRWRQGKLGCGHQIENTQDTQAKIYECQMGFRVTNIS